MCAPAANTVAAQPPPVTMSSLSLSLSVSIDQIRAHDFRAQVIDLRPGERLVLWQPQQPADVIWGGGARASLFVLTDEMWQPAGEVDSKSHQSSVNLAFVTDEGVAVLVESFEGNGWPPERVFAVAIVDGHPMMAESDDVASVDVVPRRREVRLRRWAWPINPYKDDEPLSVTAWSVARGPHGLEVSERSLTPWVDVLADFCNVARPEVADAAVLDVVRRCLGPARLRWRSAHTIEATLDLTMLCDDQADNVSDGQLILREVGGSWRVVAARGCD